MNPTLKLTSRIALLIAALGGLAWAWGWNPLVYLDRVGNKLIQAAPTVSPEKPMLRWQDAQGKTHYGTEAPPGVKAVPLSGGTVSTLEMPMPKPLEAPASESAPTGQTLQEKMIDHAIEQSTR